MRLNGGASVIRQDWGRPTPLLVIRFPPSAFHMVAHEMRATYHHTAPAFGSGRCARDPARRDRQRSELFPTRWVMPAPTRSPRLPPALRRAAAADPLSHSFLWPTCVAVMPVSYGSGQIAVHIGRGRRLD